MGMQERCLNDRMVMMKDYNQPILKTFHKLLQTAYRTVRAGSFLRTGTSLIRLAFPLVARYAMYTMLPGQEFATFFRVMLIVTAAFLLRAFLNYIITYWGHMFGVRVEADLRDDLFSHMPKA